MFDTVNQLGATQLYIKTTRHGYPSITDDEKTFRSNSTINL
jgi:hypothetical protein